MDWLQLKCDTLDSALYNNNGNPLAHGALTFSKMRLKTMSMS